MRNPFTLNDLYKQYSRGLLDRKKFEELLVKAIFENYEYFHSFLYKKDDFIEYISWLYPRLHRAIDKYQNKGATFNTYIYALIRFTVKEYRSRQEDHRITEQAAWTAKAIERSSQDLSVCSGEPEYLGSKIMSKKITNPRQFLILLLKSYFCLSDDFLERIAPAIGFTADDLRTLVNKMRGQRLRKDEEIRLLQEHISCQFYRCISFENRIAAAPENTSYLENLKGRLKRARKRLETMRTRLESTRFEATNKEIAAILNVPKGTIDSNLYALHHKYGLKNRNGQANLN
jgi:RNA polymerase sigma factor (sigma-70 family)